MNSLTIPCNNPSRGYQVLHYHLALPVEPQKHNESFPYVSLTEAKLPTGGTEHKSVRCLESVNLPQCPDTECQQDILALRVVGLDTGQFSECDIYLSSIYLFFIFIFFLQSFNGRFKEVDI